MQGVFYRAFIAQAASRLRLTGWVKNTEDGRVEIVVEGKGKNILALVEQLKKGTPAAQVENIEIKWQPYKAEFGIFEKR